MRPVPKKKQVKTGDLKSELDRLFSLYIRAGSADSSGNVICVTCYKVLHWHYAEAGHFKDRDDMSTRWDERNVFCQCKGCNRYFNIKKEEMLRRYELFLNSSFKGQNMPEKLEMLSKQPWKSSKDFYKRKISLYESKLDELGIPFKRKYLI